MGRTCNIKYLSANKQQQMINCIDKILHAALLGKKARVARL